MTRLQDEVRVERAERADGRHVAVHGVELRVGVGRASVARAPRAHAQSVGACVCVWRRERTALLLSSSERAVTSRDARRLRRLGTLRDCAKRRSRGGAPHPRTLHFTTNHYTYSTLHYNHRTSRAPRTIHCITLYRITLQYIVQYSTVHCMTIHYNHRASRAPRASHCIAHYVHS